MCSAPKWCVWCAVACRELGAAAQLFFVRNDGPGCSAEALGWVWASATVRTGVQVDANGPGASERTANSRIAPAMRRTQQAVALCAIQTDGRMRGSRFGDDELEREARCKAWGAGTAAAAG
jgi:hypothetical protein